MESNKRDTHCHFATRGWALTIDKMEGHCKTSIVMRVTRSGLLFAPVTNMSNGRHSHWLHPICIEDAHLTTVTGILQVCDGCKSHACTRWLRTLSQGEP